MRAETIILIVWIFAQLSCIQIPEKYSGYTVWRETLEGANIGEFGGKSSIRQFLNHQCFSIH